MDTSSQRHARYVCRYGRQRTGNVRDGAVPCQYREHFGQWGQFDIGPHIRQDRF